MLDKHNHLLLRDEAAEVAVDTVGVVRQDLGKVVIPVDVRRAGEEVLHELGLVRELHDDGAIAQTRGLLVDALLGEALHGPEGILLGDKLDVAVVGLGRDAVHDDVDRLVNVVQDAAVLAKEGNHLTTLGVEGDLPVVSLVPRNGWRLAQHSRS